MINYYEIEIKGKNIYRFLNKIIENKINIYDICYKSNSIIMKISYTDYVNIVKLNTIYEIKIIKISGIKKVKKIIRIYKIYLCFLIVSFILIIIYSQLVLNIYIKTDNEELKKIITSELNKNNISLYSFFQSYDKLEIISNNIRNKYKELIEWIEIEKKGIKYEITIIEKIKKNHKSTYNKSNIIAKKNGLILDLYVQTGQILKEKGDYVSKGEIIVSGNIIKSNEIKNTVMSRGKVFAETWYKVKINHPKNIFVQKNEMGITSIKIKILNKEFVFLKFKKKKLKREKSINIFKNDLFSLTLEQKYTENLILKTYSEKEIISKLENAARKEILDKIEKDEKILLQKTLKTNTDNDRIYMEIFFKVYEDIAENQEILEKE